MLTADAAEAAFGAVIAGACTDAEIAALLMALRVRGEHPDELLGLVRAMRARMTPIEAPAGAIDLCGTGGDGRATLNVSTAAAIVVAACGVPVAKHGNRAVSSSSGAADVLECLGIDPDPPLAAQTERLAQEGLAFLYAPRHHPALRHAAAARRALGIRTAFNLAGPLCNPAGVRRQLVGVSDPAWLAPIAATLATLGSERAWVVHGDGLDELALSGPTEIAVLDRGAVTRRTVTPEEAGLAPAPIEAIVGGTPAHNAAAMRELFAGARSPYRDIVRLNAAAALVIAERASTLHEGAAQAADAIDRGAAASLLGRIAARRDTLVQASAT